MATKSIDIKIASHFNSDGIIEANRGLAKLSQSVKGANDEMRQATLRAEASVNSYAAQADRAARAVGGGYKTLEQQLAELGKSHTKVGEAATKSAVGLEMAMGLARGSTEQVSKALAILSQKVPVLGKLGIAACGAWAAAIMGVLKLLSATKDLVTTAFNLDAVPKDIAEASNAMAKLNNATDAFKTSMEEAREASQAQLKTFEAEADALNKVTKAQIELNRQRDLGAATTDEQRQAINAAAESASSAADDELAQQKRDARRNELQKELSRLRAEDREANRTISAARGYFGKGQGAEDIALDAREKISDNEKKRKEIQSALSVLENEDDAANILIEARKQKEQNAAEESLKKIAEEKAKAEADAIQKAEAERIKAIEIERKAREKMEADLHKQRVEFAKTELSAAQSAASTKQSVISNAQTEFDRAFAMYRSEDKGAAQIAEERAYAADYKRLGKDAARYGGKWRIDELSALIASGDTQGQAAKLEEWRKSSGFTPEVESMVRAAAADKTKTTAEDELRKINANTANLDKKLDELLAMK